MPLQDFSQQNPVGAPRLEMNLQLAPFFSQSRTEMLPDTKLDMADQFIQASLLRLHFEKRYS
ncbi:MAG: hypothetical protein CMM07_13445 [Rhodopirellula sp.]|nr:hypothetical protein [Rhodopirellula sp.]